MAQIVRSIQGVVFASIASLLAPGCGDGGGGGGGGGSGGGGNTTTQACDKACSDPGECPSVACGCKDGSVVNTQSCLEGCCAVEADACPGACSDHGGWGSGGSGGGSSGAELGEDCQGDGDCASGHCFPVDPDDETILKCTKECTFGGGECPSGWDCAEISNGGDAIYLCIQ